MNSKLSLSSSNPVELPGADSGQRFSPTNDVIIWRSSLNRWLICFCFPWSANISSYFVHPLSVSLLLNLLLSIPHFRTCCWSSRSTRHRGQSMLFWYFELKFAFTLMYFALSACKRFTSSSLKIGLVMYCCVSNFS